MSFSELRRTTVTIFPKTISLLRFLGQIESKLSVKKRAFGPSSFFAPLFFFFFLTLPVFGQISFEAQVIRVTDGDTIAVRAGDTTFRIRLHGIDATESRQDFGPQATQALRSMLNFVSGQEGPAIQVLVTDVDRYGRMVSKLFLEEREINLELLRYGFAWHYDEYDDTPAYQQAQELAKQEGQGLWGTINPQAPWEWRRR